MPIDRGEDIYGVGDSQAAPVGVSIQAAASAPSRQDALKRRR